MSNLGYTTPFAIGAPRATTQVRIAGSEADEDVDDLPTERIHRPVMQVRVIAAEEDTLAGPAPDAEAEAEAANASGGWLSRLISR